MRQVDMVLERKLQMNTRSSVSIGNPPRNNLGMTIKRQLPYLVMVWIGLAFVIFFRFVPIYGIQLAWKELIPGMSISDSPWVGWKHFKQFFAYGSFATIMTNTLVLSFAKILFGFPAPIIFALMLNEIKSSGVKSVVQAVSYLPHFISWVVIYGIMSNILGREGGTLNSILLSLGIVDEPIHFLGSVNLFWPLMVILDVWKECGWSAIIYMAAMSSIDPTLYEAAVVDGAGKWRQIVSITLPCIVPTIITLLILRVGGILNAGFDQLMSFRNNIVWDKANIIDVYVNDVGLTQGRFGYATAVGLFQSLVGFIMVMGTNKLANKADMGIF
jgi:putative aldouronate transport system permease protein